MKKRSKIITICSSASFYKEAMEYKKKLEAMGFKVLVPVTALRMHRAGNYDVSKHKHWYKDPKMYYQKTAKMKEHLRQVEKGDITFVINLTKKGISGYIGGNVLLEIFYAWMKKKPIYILNKVSDKCGLKEEVLGMNPIFIDGDLKLIR
ncbi:MAG: hypothetical protein ABH833_00945 [Parcubacteria group bacterium]